MVYNLDIVHLCVDVLLKEMEKAFIMYVKMYTYELIYLVSATMRK